MLPSYNLSNEAEDDLLEAYIWYEQQREGRERNFEIVLIKPDMRLYRILLLTESALRKK